MNQTTWRIKRFLDEYEEGYISPEFVSRSRHFDTENVIEYLCRVDKDGRIVWPVCAVGSVVSLLFAIIPNPVSETGIFLSGLILFVIFGTTAWWVRDVTREKLPDVLQFLDDIDALSHAHREQTLPRMLATVDSILRDKAAFVQRMGKNAGTRAMRKEATTRARAAFDAAHVAALRFDLAYKQHGCYFSPGVPYDPTALWTATAHRTV